MNVELHLKQQKRVSGTVGVGMHQPFRASELSPRQQNLYPSLAFMVWFYFHSYGIGRSIEIYEYLIGRDR